MERVTLRLPQKHIDHLDALAEDGEFPNRSEAIRAAVRDLLNDYDKPASSPWSKYG